MKTCGSYGAGRGGVSVLKHSCSLYNASGQTDECRAAWRAASDPPFPCRSLIHHTELPTRLSTLCSLRDLCLHLHLVCPSTLSFILFSDWVSSVLSTKESNSTFTLTAVLFSLVLFGSRIIEYACSC